MGRSDVRSIDWKKWDLRRKKEERKDGKNNINEVRKVILFESIK